jgi:uncharacterized protein (DUF1501 family)
MFRLPLGSAARYCDGVNRRSFLQLGVAGMGAFGLGDLLRARAAEGTNRNKQTSLILLWLDGGPAHMDTYDPKPEAPAEYRGIWRHIPTTVPGMNVSEMFPKHAQVAHHFSLIRSMHHDTGDHFTGGHWMLTGRGGVSGAMTAPKDPFFGSFITKVTGPRQPGVPAYAAVPYASSIGLRPGYFGGHFLGNEHNPFETEGDPNNDNFQVRNLNLAAGLTIDRLGDRQRLSSRFDRVRRDADQSGLTDAMDKFDEQAFEFVTGAKAREAFHIQSEPDEIRERYGRNSWGQSVLLARRLVEAGSTIVTCHFGGWDSHWNHQQTMESHLPKVDSAVHGLLTDLSERGLLEQTMVIVCGEFGRTPRMNDGGNGGPPMSQGTPGRDHWGNVFSVLIAGGGIRPGQVIGSSDRLGERPVERPLRPGDLHHTIFHALGVDPHVSFLNHSGRPIHAIEHGEVIRELI